jgi:hypothetical protein
MMDVWVVKFSERDGGDDVIGVATTVTEAYKLAEEWAKKRDYRAPLPIEAFRGSWIGERGHNEQFEWYDASFNNAMKMGCTALDDDYEYFQGYYIEQFQVVKPKPLEGSIPFADLRPGMKVYTGAMYSRAVVVVSTDCEKGTAMIADADQQGREPYEFDGGRLFTHPPMGTFIMTSHGSSV